MDLIERLRSSASNSSYYVARSKLFAEAADEIERLRAALKPFACKAEQMDGSLHTAPFGDSCPLVLDPSVLGGSPTLGDCRRARAALAALYDWYDRDGSVGGAEAVFERHRAALSAKGE